MSSCDGLQRRQNPHPYPLLIIQALSLRNVKEQAAARRVLLSYHPFWLTAALEVVVGKSVDSGEQQEGGEQRL